MLGNVVNGEMRANKFERIIETEWLKTPQIRSSVELDEYVVMPNHFHAILFVTRRGVSQYAPTNKFRSPSQTIGSIIRGFKSAVTKRTNKLRNSPSTPVWQRNYYERVVRNENELNRIREYIQNNPLKWELDRENPESKNFKLDHDLYWKEIYGR